MKPKDFKAFFITLKVIRLDITWYNIISIMAHFTAHIMNDQSIDKMKDKAALQKKLWKKILKILAIMKNNLKYMITYYM